MKKKTKIFIVSLIIFIFVLGIGIFNVLAGLKFEAKIEANNVIVNDSGEEITFTISSDDLVETGLASGQFYIEYDSSIFSVQSEDGALIEGASIEYLQHSSNFSNSISEKNGVGKITVLYYDNSANLNQPLNSGDLFKIKLSTTEMPDKDLYKIKLSGEGFSTIQEDSIVDITGEFVDETIVFRERDIKINAISRKAITGEVGKPYYNGEYNNLVLNVIATDIDENNYNDLHISSREYIYGDINIDGRIDREDLNLLENHINKNNILLTSEQQKLADVNQDNNLDMLDYNLIELYIGEWKQETTIGEISNSASTIYFYGDVNLDGEINNDDASYLAEKFALHEEFTEIQKEIIDIVNDGVINSKDAVALNQYLENDSIKNIGKKIDDTEFIYGDIYIDGVVNHKDLQLLQIYYGVEDETGFLPSLNGSVSDNFMTGIQEKAADIDKDGIATVDDLMILQEYINSKSNTNFYLLGTPISSSTIYYYGDINMDDVINGEDYELLKAYENGSIQFTETQEELIDYGGDNKLDDLLVYLKGINHTGQTVGMRFSPGNRSEWDEIRENIDESFTFDTVKFKNDTIMSQNFDFTVQSTARTGIYTIYANSSYGNKNISSNPFEFVIEPKPVEEVAFVDDSYVVGIGSTKQTNSLVMPAHAYNQNVIYSVKDPDIATVDENGVVTGLSEGETYLYINSADGTRLQASTKIQVVEKNISLSNLKTDCSSFGCEEEVYDKTGGVKVMDIELQNIESTTLDYVLVKSDDNNQVNLKDQVEINFYPGDTNKLEIVIQNYDLEPGNYTFKVIGDGTIESNVVSFEILEYIPVTSIDIQFNNNSVSSLTMIKGDTIELTNILNENATNKNVVWGVDGLNAKLEAGGISSTIVKANDISEGIIYVYSDDDNSIRKQISVKIIDPTSEVQTQTMTSNIGNDRIDIKYGGTYYNVIEFNNAKEGSIVDIKITGKDNEIISENYYSINNDIIIENGKANIEIVIPPNTFPYHGKFVVEYTYEVNDSKQTKKTGTYNIVPQPFVPVSSIEVENESIILIKGQTFNINYSVGAMNSTYKELDFKSNNSKVSVDQSGKIVAVEAGESTITLEAKDDSGVKKDIVVKVIDFDISSTKHNIDSNNGIIKKVNDKLNKTNLFSNITKSENITTKIFKNNEEISDDILIGTGMILKTFANDNLLSEYKFIVSGDLNGDGKVLANDILSTKMHILEKSTLEGIYFEAGDINSDSNVNARDILSMKMYILEKTNNVWGE